MAQEKPIFLGRWQRRSNDAAPDAANVSYVADRPLTEDEYSRLRGSTALIAAVNGRLLIGPFIQSANRLAAVMDFIKKRPSLHSQDVAVIVELSLAMDEWLMQFNAYSQRLRRSIGDCLGEAAASGVQTEFDACYRTDESYALVWGLRNVAAHHFNASQLTRLEMSREEGVRWLLSGAEALSRHDRWPAGARARLSRGDVDVLELLSASVDALNTATCRVLLSNAPAIEDAAKFVLVLASEFAHLDGVPIVFSWPRDGHGPLDQLSLRADLAGHAVAGVDGAREHLGLPKKWS